MFCKNVVGDANAIFQSLSRSVPARSVRPASYGADVQRLRTLTEAECYSRCYGQSEGTVRVVKVPPRLSRYQALVSGELLRTLFEEKLDSREPEAA
jgi:hypothetical protein